MRTGHPAHGHEFREADSLRPAGTDEPSVRFQELGVQGSAQHDPMILANVRETACVGATGLGHEHGCHNSRLPVINGSAGPRGSFANRMGLAGRRGMASGQRRDGPGC